MSSTGTEKDARARSMIDKLSARFVDAVEKYGRWKDVCDSARTNRQFDRADRIARDLQSRGLVGQEAIGLLLEHANSWVRMVAATFCLRFDEARAVAVLEEVAKQPGFVGLDAEMTLQEWRAGRFKP